MVKTYLAIFNEVTIHGHQVIKMIATPTVTLQPDNAQAVLEKVSVISWAGCRLSIGFK